MVTRVTLECTAGGWKWRVYEGDKLLAQHAMRLGDKGASAKGEQKGEIYDALPKHADLAEAIDDNDPFRICQVLLES